MGGGRAAELVIDMERQIGGEDDALAASVSLTAPAGDDPQSELNFLIFDVEPLWLQAAENLSQLLCSDEGAKETPPHRSHVTQPEEER